MKYGVPQGSCLGPLLFVIYTSKLFTILKTHLPDVHAYADDTQLYISFRPALAAEQSVAINAMQDCITDIRKWMLEVKLKLNDDKTEFIIIGTRQQLAKVSVDSLQIGNETITSSSEVKNLGSWFDTQLKMDSHIGKCCRTASFHLFNIRRTVPDRRNLTENAALNAFLKRSNSRSFPVPFAFHSRSVRVPFPFRSRSLPVPFAFLLRSSFK